MREILLSGEVMDVIYYTNMIARNTLMANGDYEFLPYLMLLDASVAPKAATPKELARTLDVEKGVLEGAAARLENEEMVLRTRSPLDRRSPGYVATAAGRRHALDVNLLMREVAYKFWDIDEAGFHDLVSTVELFYRESPREWFEDAAFPVTLNSLCSLYTLWDDYVAFAHAHMLSFSGMHMLLITDQFGPQPARALYKARNQFALNDYAANVILTRERALMEVCEGSFCLTKRGRERVAELHADCSDAEYYRRAMTRADERLVALCEKMTSHAMADAADDYRGSHPHLPRVHDFSVEE